jgi:hypothetical protein
MQTQYGRRRWITITLIASKKGLFGLEGYGLRAIALGFVVIGQLVRRLGAVVDALGENGCVLGNSFLLAELTQVPAYCHDARHFELKRVVTDKIVARLERITKQPPSKRNRAEPVARPATVV